MPSVPLYEYIEGTSRKYYRIDLDDRRVLLHWGRIGTEGEHQTLSFETAALAKAEYDRQCQKRTSDRGYFLIVDESIPHDPEVVSRQRLAKTAPLGDSPRFLFVKRERFAWVEARGSMLWSVKGVRAQEDQLAPKQQQLGSPAAAIAARDAMIAKLLANGYDLETFGKSDKPTKKSKPKLVDATALERMVAEDPYDADRWSVLEDFLLEQGDVRGELVALAKAKQLAEEAQARGLVMLQLLGKKHQAISRALSSPMWRAGYLVECTIEPVRSMPEICAGLFASPAARLLRKLHVWLEGSAEAVALEVVKASLPALRELTLDVDSEAAQLAVRALLADTPIARQARVTVSL